jgi:hypothetical protein
VARKWYQSLSYILNDQENPYDLDRYINRKIYENSTKESAFKKYRKISDEVEKKHLLALKSPSKSAGFKLTPASMKEF